MLLVSRNNHEFSHRLYLRILWIIINLSLIRRLYLKIKPNFALAPATSDQLMSQVMLLGIRTAMVHGAQRQHNNFDCSFPMAKRSQSADTAQAAVNLSARWCLR